MEEGTQKALIVGIPLAIAGIGAALYFATREAAPPPFPPGCNDGDEMLEQCPDGSFIVTHRCQNGQWVPQGNTCPSPPPPQCNQGELMYQDCWDGSQIISHECKNGVWDPTGNHCPVQPPPECNEGTQVYMPCMDRDLRYLYECRNGRWGPWHPDFECPHHAAELVNWYTVNHIWLYWHTNNMGNYVPELSYRDYASGYLKSTGLYTSGEWMERLIQTLDYLSSDGSINQTQYQNAVLQGQNMGW